MKSKTVKHTILIEVDLLTSNGLIIKSRYYNSNDTINVNHMLNHYVKSKCFKHSFRFNLACSWIMRG